MWIKDIDGGLVNMDHVRNIEIWDEHESGLDSMPVISCELWAIMPKKQRVLLSKFDTKEEAQERCNFHHNLLNN